MPFANSCAIASASPWSPTTSTPRKTRNSSCAAAHSPASASSVSRRAAARTRRFARTPRSTWKPSTTSRSAFPPWISSWWKAAATIWRRPSAPSWRTSPCMSSTWRAGTRFRARAARVSPSRIFWSSTKSIAPYVGASLEVMDRDARAQRGSKPFMFTNIRQGIGVDGVVEFVVKQGLLGVSGLHG